jgi:uncharacterized protein
MPESVAVQDGLFTMDEEPRLLGGKCTGCGRHQFPRGPMCPYCGADDVAEALLSGRGTLWAWTAVTAPPPGYQGDVPYGFGVVELPEGIRILTRLIESDPSALTFGQEMTLQLVPLHADDEGHDVMTWAFG